MQAVRSARTSQSTVCQNALALLQRCDEKFNYVGFEVSTKAGTSCAKRASRARAKRAIRIPALSILPDERRSKTMRAVKSSNTSIELTIRELLIQKRYSFQLHRKDLAGCPDIVFPRRRKVIFINGCFWHGHRCERGNRLPKTNAAYWRAKIGRNKARDIATRAELRSKRWSVMTIWECQLRRQEALQKRLSRFLDAPRAPWTVSPGRSPSSRRRGPPS
jgi:DNA mismatch endonuclease, patch repair protein